MLLEHSEVSESFVNLSIEGTLPAFNIIPPLFVLTTLRSGEFRDSPQFRGEL